MGRSEKSSIHDGSHGVVEVASEVTWSPDVERKLVRKIDILLLPILWLMSLLSWMDRANLGNANIAGLTSDLHLSSTQFSLAIITFYFGYIAWVPISNTILARTRPSLYLPSIMILWGAVTCGIAGVKTYPQLLVLRTLMGVLEGGLTPGVALVFSCWYRPGELGKRASFFITAGQLGGAFGGLIAGGVIGNLEGARGLRGWRWLFIVEGVVTIAAAMIAMFVLPDYPATSRWFTADERAVAVRRLQIAGIVINEDDSKPKIGPFRALGLALKEWKTYGVSLAGACIGATVAMAYFYPALVKGLGYTNPVTAQYMTVPIWVVAFVFAIAVGVGADRIPHQRTLFIAGCLLLLTVMGVATCAVYDFTARYVFLSFMTGGVWGAFSQAVAFMAEVFQDRPPEMRAVAMGIMTMVSNTSSIYGAYLFPKEHAPKYLLGFSMVAGTGGASTIIYILMWSAIRREKRQRTG